jgi:hypothetical protein
MKAQMQKLGGPLTWDCNAHLFYFNTRTQKIILFVYIYFRVEINQVLFILMLWR